MATMIGKGCSAPVSLRSAPVFICPLTATFSDVTHWYGDAVPACSIGSDGKPIVPADPADACEVLEIFNQSGTPGYYGTPIAGYGFVVAAELTQGPVSQSCPNGCPNPILPPPGTGGLRFFP